MRYSVIWYRVSVPSHNSPTCEGALTTPFRGTFKAPCRVYTTTICTPSVGKVISGTEDGYEQVYDILGTSGSNDAGGVDCPVLTEARICHLVFFLFSTTQRPSNGSSFFPHLSIPRFCFNASFCPPPVKTPSLSPPILLMLLVFV